MTFHDLPCTRCGEGAPGVYRRAIRGEPDTRHARTRAPLATHLVLLIEPQPLGPRVGEGFVNLRSGGFGGTRGPLRGCSEGARRVLGGCWQGAGRVLGRGGYSSARQSCGGRGPLTLRSCLTSSSRSVWYSAEGRPRGEAAHGSERSAARGKEFSSPRTCGRPPGAIRERIRGVGEPIQKESEGVGGDRRESEGVRRSRKESE